MEMTTIKEAAVAFQVFSEACAQLADNWARLMDSLYSEWESSAPSQRVLYLSKHHRKARVRKKNTRRIIRNMRKWRRLSK